VMELCVDNPREGFVDLFATHPPVERRISALVNFAGGHDPGPIELAPPPEPQPEETSADAPSPLPPPQGAPEPGKPFLPEHSPLGDRGSDQAGPWGPHRGG
ncbi:MAG: peptidase M48 Ste24p, partial [Xanthobacteraceae bacterium]